MNYFPQKPHAQLHLPALTPEEALLIVGILDNMCSAIWRTHGDAIVEFLDKAENDIFSESETLDKNDIPF